MKRAIFLMVIYFVLSQIAGLFLVVAAFVQSILRGGNMAGLTKSAQSSSIMTAGLGIVLLVSQIIMIWFMWHFHYLKPAKDFTGKVSWVVFLICVPLVVAFGYSLNCVNEWIDLPNLVETEMDGMIKNVSGIISIVIGAPFMEELMFRGAIEGHFLRQGKSPWFAILISGLFFGLYHMNPAQIPFAFLLGCLLGWLYYRTGSLWPGILCHAVNNGLAVILSFVYTDKDNISDIITNSTLKWGLALIGIIITVLLVMVIARIVLKPKPITELEGSEIIPSKVSKDFFS